MDPDDASDRLTGAITRKFHLTDEVDSEGKRLGYFTYSGVFGGKEVQEATGQKFQVPYDPDGEHSLTEGISLRTDAGETMELKFENDLANLTDMRSSITYGADESVSVAVSGIDSSETRISANDMDFQAQRFFGRNFDQSGATVNGSLTRTFVRR